MYIGLFSNIMPKYLLFSRKDMDSTERFDFGMNFIRLIFFFDEQLYSVSLIRKISLVHIIKAVGAISITLSLLPFTHDVIQYQLYSLILVPFFLIGIWYSCHQIIIALNLLKQAQSNLNFIRNNKNLITEMESEFFSTFPNNNEVYLRLKDKIKNLQSI